MVAEGATPHSADRQVGKEEGGNINAVKAGGSGGAEVSIGPAARVACAEGVQQVWQGLLPAPLGAGVRVVPAAPRVEAVKLEGGHKVKVATPQQLLGASAGSEGPQHIGNELPLLGGIVRHIDAAYVEAVAAPAHRHGNVAALRVAPHSSITTSHSEGAIPHKGRPYQNGGAAAGAAGGARGAVGKVASPAQPRKLLLDSDGGEEGEVGFLNEDKVVAGTQPIGSCQRHPAAGGQPIDVVAAAAQDGHSGPPMPLMPARHGAGRGLLAAGPAGCRGRHPCRQSR